MSVNLINHIEIVDGKAILSRRQLKAEIVAAMVVKAGATIEETMEEYELTRAEVHAALTYYYDNEEAIEESFRSAENYARRVGTAADEHVETIKARRQNKE